MDLVGKLNAELQLSGNLNPQLGLRGFLAYAGDRAPYIGENGHWYTYDTTAQAFTDSGYSAAGLPGKGLDILGTYASVAALDAAVTSPKQGDVYNVGAANPYELYMWDAVLGWLSQGILEGPQGPKGDTGEKGPKGDKGDPGAAGYTPVRGTDYWTAADITTMESYLNNYVNTVILGGAS